MQSYSDYIDKYTLVALMAAIVGQAIIDAYEGNQEQKESALRFFQSQEYKDVIVAFFRKYKVKFEKMFPGCEGTFMDIANYLMKKGGAETLYKACAITPVLLGMSESKTGFGIIKGKIKTVSLRKTGVAHCVPFQLAL